MRDNQPHFCHRKLFTDAISRASRKRYESVRVFPCQLRIIAQPSFRPKLLGIIAPMVFVFVYGGNSDSDMSVFW